MSLARNWGYHSGMGKARSVIVCDTFSGSTEPQHSFLGPCPVIYLPSTHDPSTSSSPILCLLDCSWCNTIVEWETWKTWPGNDSVQRNLYRDCHPQCPRDNQGHCHVSMAIGLQTNKKCRPLWYIKGIPDGGRWSMIRHKKLFSIHLLDEEEDR